MITVRQRSSMTFRSASNKKIPFYRDADPVRKCGPKMHWRLLMHLVWVSAGMCVIQDRDDIDRVGPLTPRRAQLKMAESMLGKAAAGRKIRENVPKSRRHGASTWTQSVFCFMCKICISRNALTVAHSEKQTLEIFAISHRMMKDEKADAPKNKAEKNIKFEATGSKYSCISGLANYAASGSTTHFLHISEYAKFPNKSGQDKVALRSMINSMSQVSRDTIVVIESSGEGPEGDWVDRVNAAEEGTDANEFTNVFLPWTDDPANSADPDEVPEWFPDRLGKYEQRLIDEFGLTLEQVYWRHAKIKSEYPGEDPADNVIAFGYDWPLEIKDLFGVKSGRVYAMLSRESHEREVRLSDLSSNAYAIRVIDWGATAENPFAVGFFYVDPEKPAGFTASASCANFWTEGNRYAYGKNGRPIDKWNHLMDVVRMLVVTRVLDCYVHLYDEIYFTDFNQEASAPSDLARLVHEQSGWVHPFKDDRKSQEWANLLLYRRGPGAHEFDTGIADRSGPDRIKTFTRWGIPLIAHSKSKDREHSRGEIEDGIALVSALMRATSTNPHGKKPVDQVLARALKRHAGEGFRPQAMTPEEAKALEQAYTEARASNGVTSSDNVLDPLMEVPANDIFFG